jgi:Zn-finger nucleic acid-binding protein
MGRQCVMCGKGFAATKIGEIEVDLCPGCGGLWLDNQELNRLAKMSAEAVAALRAQLPKATGAPADRAERQRLEKPCPACPGKLTYATVGSTGLEVCSRCGGAFLDAGELEQVIAEVRGRGEEIATIVGLARSVSTHGTIGK